MQTRSSILRSAVAAVMVLAVSALVPAQTPWTDGEVIKVDRAHLKISIKHGGIRSLDMPPMTMAFKARDAAMLEGLAPGVRVRFRAERSQNQYAVTAIEPRR